MHVNEPTMQETKKMKEATPIEAAMHALAAMQNALDQGKGVWCGYSAAKRGMDSYTNWDPESWQRAMQFFEAVSVLHLEDALKIDWRTTQ